MAKKTISKKSSAKTTPKAAKSAPRRSVAQAAPPTALDHALAMDEETEEEAPPAPSPVKLVASRPIGKVLTLPAPVAVLAKPASDFVVDEGDEGDEDEEGPSSEELDAEEDEERERVAIRQEGSSPKKKGGDAVNAAFWEQSEKLGPAFGKAITTRKMRMRIERIFTAVSRWELDGQPEMTKALGLLGTALDSLNEAVVLFEAVPRDWRPGKSRKVQGEGAKLSAGTTVAIREKLRAGYVEALDEGAEALENLTVVRHAKKVVVKTPAGLNYVIPRGHLIVIPSASA